MITMDNNAGHGQFEVDVIVERDQGIFLGLNVSNDKGDVVDAYTTDPDEIEQFFREVAEAKADWERLKVLQEQGEGVNRVELSGHLTRDPDLRFVGDNFPICNLNIAVHDDGGRFNRETKKTETESGFYQVEVKGDYGAYIQSVLGRGDEVHVVGSLSQWRTTPREGRESETKTRITAKVVTVLTPPRAPREPIQPPVAPLTDEPADTWSAQGGGWGG